MESKRNVVPTGQRDQSAAALPILGGCGLALTTTRLPRTIFTVRVVVIEADVALLTAGRVLGSSSFIENGCGAGVYEAMR